MPSFVTEGCSEIFVPVSSHTFTLSLPQQDGSRRIVSVLRTGNTASVTNHIPVYIFKNLSQFSGFVNHDHVSYHLMFQLNPRQHRFTKSKHTKTNMVTYLDFITPLVGFQVKLMPFILILTKLSTLSLKPSTSDSQRFLEFLVVM
jgi:hypothetical protein